MHSLNVGTHAITSGNWDTIYARYLTEILKRGVFLICELTWEFCPVHE